MRRHLSERLTDLLARAGVCVLFTLLCLNLLRNFMRTGHVTSLLLLASESLVIVLTIVRRRTGIVDRSTIAAVVTTASIVAGLLLRATDRGALLPDAATAAVSAVGLALVLVGKLALGRSFGIVPANRGVVAKWPYTLIRHPIYTGYMITHVAFIAANPRPLNALLIAVADGGLIVRALLEERVLRTDATYRDYCQRVGWRVVPGLF